MSDSIHCIAIDDEENNLKNLAGICQQFFPHIRIIETAANADTGMKLISSLKPDLVFLDIQMPGMSVFEMLEKLDYRNFEIIFVTAFEQYAIQAIKLSALDYILKPVNPKELAVAIRKAELKIADKQRNERLHNLIENLPKQNPEKKIALPSLSSVEYVPVKHIIRCEGDNNYTRFILENGPPILVSKTLKEFEELLSDFNFLRVHITHLINLDKIVQFLKRENCFKMSDGSHVYISRHRKDEVLERIKKQFG